MNDLGNTWSINIGIPSYVADKTKHLDALDNQVFGAPYSVVNQCVFVESKIKEQISCDQYTPFIAFIDLVLRRAARPN